MLQQLLLDLISCPLFANKSSYRLAKWRLFVCAHCYPSQLWIFLYQPAYLLQSHPFSGFCNFLSCSFVMLTVAGILRVFNMLATETRIVSFAVWLRL